MMEKNVNNIFNAEPTGLINKLWKTYAIFQHVIDKPPCVCILNEYSSHIKNISLAFEHQSQKFPSIGSNDCFITLLIWSKMYKKSHLDDFPKRLWIFFQKMKSEIHIFCRE